MKFSSGERRATVLLLILTGVLIGVMFLLRSDPPLQTLPTVAPVAEDVVADTIRSVKWDTVTVSQKEDAVRRKKTDKPAKQQKKESKAASGRKRDFLDEPVKR